MYQIVGNKEHRDLYRGEVIAVFTQKHAVSSHEYSNE